MKFKGIDLLIKDKNIKVTSIEIANILKQENFIVNRKIEQELKNEIELNIKKKEYNHELKDGGIVKRTYYVLDLKSALYIMSCFNNGIAKELKYSFINQYCNSSAQSIEIELTNGIKFERKENKFKEQLFNMLTPLRIKIETQKIILNGKYRIDFYLPEFSLAIEYDEEQHNSDTNKKKDKQREEEIKEELHCEFIRLSYKETDTYNVGLVLKKIFNR